MSNLHRSTLALAIMAGTVLVLAPSASAQRGYLFRNPQVSWTMRVGGAQPAAEGEIYNFFTRELTIDRDDFKSVAWGGDLGIRVHPQIDALFSVTVARSSTRSEFRDWVDENDQPIEQVTRLRRTPLTAGVKFYPLDRGRELGRYAFIPARFLPYIGVAGGVMLYRLEQEGDFVDFQTEEIFTDYLESSGTAPTAHVFGGSELWLLSRLGLNVEARYMWASANLQEAFEDVDEKIDLRGFQLTAGLSVRF
jgi:hypothetical protein